MSASAVAHAVWLTALFAVLGTLAPTQTWASLHSFSVEEPEAPLIFVNVLFRHGDRTPIKTFPTDPYQQWDIGWGQLTNAGKKRQYELGQWLRSRYSGLLGSEYRREKIRVLSTDVDRCLMSAECNMAALFPPPPAQVWGPINWQPIPVHTVPAEMDKVLAMRAPCPKYDSKLDKARKSDYYKEENKKYKPVFKHLSKHTGLKISDIKHCSNIYTTIDIEVGLGLEVGEWTKAVYPEPLRTMKGIDFAMATFSNSMKRLKSGPLLKDMLTNFDNKISPSEKLQVDANPLSDEDVSLSATDSSANVMQIYSAHDSTMANLLNTLGVYDMRPPPFAATVLLELRQNTSNKTYFVNLLYKNSTGLNDRDQGLHMLEVPTCGKNCPLPTFKALYEHLIPQDWDAECKHST